MKKIKKLKNKIKGLEKDIEFLYYNSEIDYNILKYICNKLNIKLEVDLDGTYLEGKNISK